MIVIIKERTGDETVIEHVDAIVFDGKGNLRFCRDGQPDQYIDNRPCTVVNDG